MSRVLGAKEITDLFSDARSYRSKGTVRATRVSKGATWTTTGGDTLAAREGDWWVIDGDDRWSIADDIFNKTYESLGDGRYRKKVAVEAVIVNEPFSISTLEGVASGEAGDWLVRNPSGEIWPVTKDVFARRYEKCTGGSSLNCFTPPPP